jgi:DNA recombination protein RmuC
MAEDVLRLAGFVEGVNYHKQKQLTEGSRPDFTFLLPENQCVHMDVKFPLANYVRMLEAADDPTRAACAGQFLKDVRLRVKEVTTRDYINPAAGTVDYCLVFIPNEQIYGFIHEQDGSLLDEALRQKVVLCSPLTLYAILAVIRQAVENFRLEQASMQILSLLAEFKKQWTKYVAGMDKMGERLEAAGQEYRKLVSTRTRQLERQLDKIEDLRAAREQQAAPHELPAE